MKLTVDKIIVTVCAVCCLHFPSGAQFETKLSELKVKGNVKEIQDTEYQVIDNNYLNLKEERMVMLSFDKKGNKTEEKYLSPEKKIIYSSEIKYATSGKLLEETVNCFGFGKDFKKTYHVESKKITVHTVYENEDAGVKHYSEYALNPDGAVAKRTDWLGNDKIMEIKYTYSKGLLQTETNQTAENTLRFKYEYNKKGEPVKKSEMATDGKIVYSVAYTYDSRGNVLSETSSYTGEEKTVITYKYVYDSKGNWTEKQEKMNNNLFSLTKRNITYY
ncbi:MAG: hypothetical protein LBG92_02990 [Prevotellaceae bacterium]|jgi:hypothetical protein|nr:hypothetical protein [Prevotellaceae bacterium]